MLSHQTLAASSLIQDYSQGKQADFPSKQNPPKGQIGWLLAWRDQLPSQSQKPRQGTYKTIKVKNILEENLESYGSNIQALYLNINWSSFTLQKFEKLEISQTLLRNGMVFVWAQKQSMDQVMTHLQKFEINYVEIFTIALFSIQSIKELDVTTQSKGTLFNFFQKKVPSKQKTVQDYLKMKCHQFPNLKADQVMCRHNSQWLKKSKRNLLLLRKTNKKQTLQLRHQRTSDIFFALYDEQKQQMQSKAEQCVYKMIQTLLIKANYCQGQPLKMMQLWAKPGHSRQGWISISQQDK